ncbi:hypothetical protein FGK63_17540 [Ruegeria sediminis]|uniref:Uncharacterized protein n=1 Tax=Ruegeria sediminis TaxID=2583820 RepID=A0ABY2WTM9_9RHOB|nr:DUF6544 family protein [Ruegeria sediminis]TMV04883.1 hypothetical protein FGK63_17540 [Ruegeria sediminis]
MTTLFALAAVVPAVILAGLLAWRQQDHRADAAEMARLLALQPRDPQRFSADMVAGLPEPARRFFRFAIAEGTPLCTVAQIGMKGKFGLGSKNAPNYMDMTAEQVLAAPEGFVWKMSAGSGLSRLSGSDGTTWTRFWLAGLVPVARLGGDPDHSRSAFGRYVAEAVFWTPAALLPGPDVTWEQLGDDAARVVVRHGGLEQSVDVTVGEDGRPTRVEFPRWSNANPDNTFRVLPFGGYLSNYAEFAGFRLPTHVEAGNFFGTGEYFPFFVIDVTDIRFPAPVS